MWKRIILAAVAGSAAFAMHTDYQDEAYSFDELELYLEANTLDQDSEIVLKVESKEELKRLMIRDPFGQAVYDMHFNDPSGIGSSEVRVESGEPSLSELRAAFPEGEYGVFGLTQSGKRIYAEASLSHALPSRFAILSPSTTALVDPESTLVEWVAYPGVESFTLEIETDEDDKSMIIKVPGDVSQFSIPSVLLKRDTEHQLVLIANAPSGNKLVQEIYFTTIP